MRSAGAGRTADEAAAPAIVPLPGKGRALIYGTALSSSGVPASWAAGSGRPGVNLLSDLSEQRVLAIADQIREARESEDIVILSIHWGSNWGYTIPKEQRAFAHALIDRAGVDIVHGIPRTIPEP
jgi:poly-gamma-glutamate synthesis protein (capsule biosynthesis protein)